MDRLLTGRIIVAVALGTIAAVVLDQILLTDRDPSIADSLRFGLLGAALLVFVARKAVRDRQRAEDRRIGPT